MIRLEGGPSRRRLIGLAAGAIAVASLTLVLGLAVPGFLNDSSESSTLPGTPVASSPDDRPWALLHPSPRRLPPDAALARLVHGFVDRLNGRRASEAVDMLCPDERRVIRGPVVWTATHRPHLRLTTRLKDAAGPGYVTVEFAGVIGGRQRRGTIGMDADRAGRAMCVSAFYSVG